jgi:pilus assembly protein FimV
MNLRKVAVLLITSLSFATVLPAFTADFQQVEIKGPKNGTEQYSGTIYGPIDSSDTLWRIANRYRQNKNLTIYQVMLAIYQLNPTAFEENNLNLLKDGSTLRLPSERYIARINKQEALEKTQQDEVLWQAQLPAGSKATADNLKPTEKLASKSDLDQTKQVLEKRLGAIDEEQNRQFMAIRQQFAESINSVQTILNENQKLFERLDSVNTDLNDLQSSEAQRDQQIGQMGISIDELLERSRQEDQQKKAAEAKDSGSDWLRDPITLIIITLVMSLAVLAGFGYWLIGRKRKVKSQEELAAFANEAPPIPRSTELDDLSDALSNELSEELENESDDDDLFGEDDLLDDVLSQELEESLDDSIESELEDFDDFGDEMLVPDESKEGSDFDSDSEAIEQDDLDSLFDEDDDLLAEIDEDIDSIDLSDDDDESIDLSDTEEDDLVEAEIFENEDLPDEIEEFDEETPLEQPSDIDEQPEAMLEEQHTEPEAASENLSKINDDQEKPEISIDELLDEQKASLPEAVDVDEPDLINEEMLQQLDKEISSQSEELDSITSTLLDELEQVEQMRVMLPEEDESAEGDISNDSDMDQQHDIQKLDELTDVFDDALLSDEEDDDIDDMSEDDLALEAELEEEPEVNAETKLDEEPEVDTEAALDEKGDSDTEAELDEEPEVDTKAELDEEPDADTEAELDEEPDADTEAELDEEPDADTEAELEEEPEADTEAALDEESDAGTEAELEEEADADTEAESEEEADADTEAESDEEPDADTEAELDEEPDADTEAELEEEPGVDTEAETDEKSDLDTELDKALEDFEDDQPFQSNKNINANDEDEVQPLDSSLEDLEFGKTPEDSADLAAPEGDFTETSALMKPLPDLEDIGSLTDFDDAELEKALQEIDSADEQEYQRLNVSPDIENKELEDVPGLGDWLSDSGGKDDSDEVLLDELENSSFDELLETIDIDEGEESEEDDDSDLDIEALLSADSESEPSSLEETVEKDDFLDVEALLTESIDAESDPLSEKNLDLDISFGEFTGVTDDSDSVDVDGDKGVGAKLDLAHAYIEMGEKDSAKELLEEIIANGNPEQIEEAQNALVELG